MDKSKRLQALGNTEHRKGKVKKMTNLEIIINEALKHEIYTEEEIEEKIENDEDLKIHTFAIWKAKGYKVKKGEHARIVTRLWKYKKGNKKEHSPEEEEEAKMYLCKAFLFTEEQVEKLGA